MINPRPKIPFTQILDALLDNAQPFPPQFLYRFSDLQPEDQEALGAVWTKIETQRRINLLEDLEDLLESDTVLLFDEISQLALKDPEAQVRTVAVRLQAENPKESRARVFMHMAEKDSDEFVRAAAVSSLGQYVYLGELDKISPETLHLVEDKLFNIVNGQDTDLVRRRALESVGFCSREETVPLIEKAYQHKDTGWVASALFAMGRSMDSRWEKEVMGNLNSPDPELSFEAIRAAGKMEIQAARPRLLKMLASYDELDEDVRGAVIWSLSEIGGEGVRKKLEGLLEQLDDDDEIEYLEEALENLEFTEDFKLVGMFDIETLKNAELDTVIDLEHDRLEDDEPLSWEDDEYNDADEEDEE
jgi:HEAT repeat protein